MTWIVGTCVNRGYVVRRALVSCPEMAFLCLLQKIWTISAGRIHHVSCGICQLICLQRVARWWTLDTKLRVRICPQKLTTSFIYFSGYNLNLLYDPPSNIEEICNGNFTSECASMCSTVSCCFSESLPSSYSNDTSTNTNASSCYAYFEQTCSGYAPFCDPVDAVVLPNPPADLEVLCSFEFADLCRAACDVASCCFGQSSESSCVENNEELCQSYYPCAVLYSGWKCNKRALQLIVNIIRYHYVINSI